MKSFFTFLFLGSTFFAVSQNKISGTISDQNSIKLEGVNISIPELRQETQSDKNGFYLLTIVAYT